MNNLEIVTKSFKDKFGVDLSIFEAEQLLSQADDDVQIVIRSVGKAQKSNAAPDNPFKYVRSVIIGEKQRAKAKAASDVKASGAIVNTIKQCYQMFVDDGAITDDEYNTILRARTGQEYSVAEYQQAMFRIQKRLYRHPIQWVHGLGLTVWEKEAFANLGSEQQSRFDIDEIQMAGTEYRNQYEPDPEMTPETIAAVFGIRQR